MYVVQDWVNLVHMSWILDQNENHYSPVHSTNWRRDNSVPFIPYIFNAVTDSILLLRRVRLQFIQHCHAPFLSLDYGNTISYKCTLCGAVNFRQNKIKRDLIIRFDHSPIKFATARLTWRIQFFYFPNGALETRVFLVVFACKWVTRGLSRAPGFQSHP